MPWHLELIKIPGPDYKFLISKEIKYRIFANYCRTICLTLFDWQNQHVKLVYRN
jgi:hypothetical protein